MELLTVLDTPRSPPNTDIDYTFDWEVAARVAKTVCYQAAIRWDDKEDFVSDVLAEMMERARRDSGGLSTKEMWQAAGCVRSRYRRTYKKAIRNSSLNELIPGTTLELIETIADDKALDPDALLDAKSRLEQLPPGIVALGRKLERGDPLTANQRLYLSRFRKGETKIKPNKRITNFNTYHRLRAQGLCAGCGKESGKFCYCPACREKHALYKKEHRAEIRVWENTLAKHWRRQGKCPNCGAIPEPGFKTCSTCRAKNRKRTATCRIKKHNRNSVK